MSLNYKVSSLRALNNNTFINSNAHFLIRQLPMVLSDRASWITLVHIVRYIYSVLSHFTEALECNVYIQSDMYKFLHIYNKYLDHNISTCLLDYEGSCHFCGSAFGLWTEKVQYILSPVSEATRVVKSKEKIGMRCVMNTWNLYNIRTLIQADYMRELRALFKVMWGSIM